MARRMSRNLLIGLVVFVVLCGLVTGEIHRAKALKQKFGTKNGRQESHQPHKRTPAKEKHSRETWILSIASSVLVGLSGIFPLLVIPLEAGKSLRKGAAAARLKLLLSFAVGGLLGDVFLHLLPEAWKHVGKEGHVGHMKIGLWVLGGLMAFLCVEKIFPDQKDDDEDEGEHTSITSSEDISETTLTENMSIRHRKTTEMNGNAVKNGIANGHSNGFAHPIANGNGHVTNVKLPNGYEGHHEEHTEQSSLSRIKTSGWLNLLANVVDNFTHGLAVAGSYCAGTKSGILTTIIILLHEIPHEIGDFAILLRSGFDRWKAAKAQLLTASGGVLGALTALGAESASAAGDSTAWILPFTAGGFIYIALVTVVPDLLKEESPWESLKQVLLLCAGIGAMASIAMWIDEHDLPNLEWLVGS